MEISEKNTKKEDQSKCHSDNLSICTQIYICIPIYKYILESEKDKIKRKPQLQYALNRQQKWKHLKDYKDIQFLLVFSHH